jgi:protease YdgD
MKAKPVPLIPTSLMFVAPILAIAFGLMAGLGLVSIAEARGAELRPGVIGKDDQKIIDEKGAPWSSIGQVNIGGYRMSGTCTGSLIASNLVVTAAHCIMDPWKAKPWPLRHIHFLAAVKRGKWLGHSTAKCLHFSPGYEYVKHRINPNLPLQKAPRHFFFKDIVLIVLKDNMSDIAPLQVAKGVEDLPANTELTHASYPADRRHMLSGHFGCRLTEKTDERLWITDCDSHPGSSGGPILIQYEAELSLAALLVGGSMRSDSIALPIGKWVNHPANRTCP